MSRPKEIKSGRNVSIWLSDELIKELDQLAGKAEISRSRLIQNILEINAQELTAMDRIGLYKFSIVMRDLHDRMKGCVPYLSGESATG